MPEDKSKPGRPRTPLQAYRQAQGEEARRAAPILVLILAALVVAASLAPGHRGWVLVGVGLALALFGTLSALRVRPDERYGPAQVKARSHFWAVAVGGALVAGLGALTGWL